MLDGANAPLPRSEQVQSQGYFFVLAYCKTLENHDYDVELLSSVSACLVTIERWAHNQSITVT